MAVGSVVNAIAILRHLAGSEPLGVNAIARAVEISPSTCFNILKTLAVEEFVEFDAASKAYSLGNAPSQLFGGADFGALKGRLRERLEQMATNYSVCCGLWEARGNRVVLTDVFDSPLSTRIYLSAGQRLPSHIGAMGRCIAWHEGIKRSELESVISELRWQSPPSTDAYWRDMLAVEKRGWAIDEGHFLRGVTTVASAIVNERDKVSHCLTSVLFSGQHDQETLEEIGRGMAELAHEAKGRLRERSKRPSES